MGPGRDATTLQAPFEDRVARDIVTREGGQDCQRESNAMRYGTSLPRMPLRFVRMVLVSLGAPVMPYIQTCLPRFL